MRLVCPNCGAQYEVEDSVIPDSGRDVQCSACGHAWYQMPMHLVSEDDVHAAEPDEFVGSEDEVEPAAENELEPEPETAEGFAAEPDAADASEAALFATPEPAEEPETEAAFDDSFDAAAVAGEPGTQPDSVEEPASEAVVETAAEAGEEVAEVAEAAEAGEEPETGATEAEVETGTDDTGAEEPEPAPAAGTPPPARDIDENLREILREEAEREMQARATERTHEPQAMETQPDLGLDSLPSADEERRRIARERMAAMRGFDDEDEDEWDTATEPEPEDEPDLAAGAAGAAVAGGVEADRHGRALFPDIDEINSTLDNHDTGAEHEVYEPEVSRRSGFGRGFMSVILVALLALALYLFAPRLAETFPALEPTLTAYVAAVNAGREWLDVTVQALIVKLESAAGNGG